MEHVQGQGAMVRQGSILGALEHLERDKIARYCESMTVDGVIAQSASIRLRSGQTLWCSRGSLMVVLRPSTWASRGGTAPSRGTGAPRGPLAVHRASPFCVSTRAMRRLG